MISQEQEDRLRRVMRVVTMYVIQTVKGGVKVSHIKNAEKVVRKEIRKLKFEIQLYFNPNHGLLKGGK